MTWTGRRVRRLVVVGAVLAVQLLVPPLALRHVRPAALGWHMFVAVKDKPEITLVFLDGRREPADINDYIVRFRPEIDVERRLTPELCDRHPGLASVRYERNGTLLGDVAC